MITSGKKLIDARKNGDLRWLRPDGKTQVTIEYVPRIMEEIVEVVRLILQERVQQRTVEQIVDVPVPQVVEEIAEVVETIPRSVSQNRSPTESLVHQQRCNAKHRSSRQFGRHGGSTSAVP